MPEPAVVQRLIADLREAGFEPAVHGSPGGAWQVVIEGEHVRVTADFVFRNGRTKWTPGSCTVDGKPHPLVHPSELRAFWNEHEGAAAQEPELEPAVLLEIADPGGEPVPYVVRATRENVEQGLVTVGIDRRVLIGLSGSHWVIGIDLPGGDGLRLVFTRYNRRWELDRQDRVQVVIGGQDYSAEAGNDIGKAVALLTRNAPPQPGDPPPGSSAVRQQTSTRNQGVETRRRVVIRE